MHQAKFHFGEHEDHEMSEQIPQTPEMVVQQNNRAYQTLSRVQPDEDSEWPRLEVEELSTYRPSGQSAAFDHGFESHFSEASTCFTPNFQNYQGTQKTVTQSSLMSWERSPNSFEKTPSTQSDYQRSEQSTAEKELINCFETPMQSCKKSTTSSKMQSLQKAPDRRGAKMNPTDGVVLSQIMSQHEAYSQSQGGPYMTFSQKLDLEESNLTTTVKGPTALFDQVYNCCVTEDLKEEQNQGLVTDQAVLDLFMN